MATAADSRSNPIPASAATPIPEAKLQPAAPPIASKWRNYAAPGVVLLLAIAIVAWSVVLRGSRRSETVSL
jgi:hypothetical protein